jgi:hypothetical protein
VSRRETKWHRLVETHHITSTFLLRVTMREGKAVPEAQEERERPTTPRGEQASSGDSSSSSNPHTSPAQPGSPARLPNPDAMTTCRLVQAKCRYSWPSGTASGVESREEETLNPPTQQDLDLGVIPSHLWCIHTWC